MFIVNPVHLRLTLVLYLRISIFQHIIASSHNTPQAEEVVPSAVDNQMEHKVDDEKTCCPVHARWVNFIGLTEGAKPWQERQNDCQGVQSIHDSKVPARFLPESDSWLAGQTFNNLREAHEVEKV